MIQTSLSNLIVYNLSGLLLLLGFLWIYRVVRARLHEHRRNRHRVVCGICGHLFLNRTREQAVECPSCHRLVPRQEVLNL
ncbi:MAG TPA: hypothetical protein VHM91_18190 [Verrucomicrobiales bacterium]|jgi:hypothetical protein|nr:hypothetical protein [Verrucomicrobiales bacterium]